jgi:hypothetical protein
MSENKTNSIPRGSLEDLIEFFDTQDMGDYWDELPEAHFDVDLRKRTHLAVLQEDVSGKIAAKARQQRVSSDTLINDLLREKLAEAG